MQSTTQAIMVEAPRAPEGGRPIRTHTSGPAAVYELPSVLPGRLLMQRGRAEHYTALSRFHYLCGRPATFADVWVVYYVPATPPAPHAGAVLAAVGVLSHPTLAFAAREQVLGITAMPPRQRFRFVNRNVRTISRIAVHPTFRSLGVARALVRCLIHHCPTRYVEAAALMGHAHPLFEHAGMTAYRSSGVAGELRPVYYLFDRLRDGVCDELDDWRSMAAREGRR